MAYNFFFSELKTICGGNLSSFCLTRHSVNLCGGAAPMKFDLDEDLDVRM